MSDGNIDSLPKWAQSALRVARDNAEIANRRLAQAIGEKPSVIEIDPYRELDKKPRCFAHDSATVRFTVNDGYVDVAVRNGGVEVMGMGPLVITPSSSNTFRITMRERF